MKVLIVDQIAKTTYKFTYSLANALKKRGVDVKLAIDQMTRENCECEYINLFNTDEKKVNKINKLFNYIASYKKIIKMIKKEKIEIIHTQWVIFSPIDYLFLRRIKRHSNVKMIMTIHDILPFNEKKYDKFFHEKIYGLADEIIVQAENNVLRFDKLFPLLSNKVHMIPLGHLLDYTEFIEKSAARQYLQLPENKTILLFFGQIKKVKGVGVLLEALAKIKEKHPDILLVIAGSVWKDDFSQYQRIIDQYDMSSIVREDIKYIPDEDIKYYYGACDCCVLPYLDVYQSGVVQLAYAYKKPAIATNIGAFKEVIIDNTTGFMCEPGDVDDLACVINKALVCKQDFQTLGEAGYSYIKEKFSWDKIAREVHGLYE